MQRKEQTELLEAIKAAYTMIISINLTQNSYHVIVDKEKFIKVKQTGSCDELIDQIVKFIPDTNYAKAYKETFCHDSLMDAYKAGKPSVLLQHTMVGENSIVHWIDTSVIFVAKKQHSDVLGIVLEKVVDDNQSRINELQKLLKKETIFHEGLMESCAGYMEINLTTGYLVGDILDYTSNNVPHAFKIADLDTPVRFDEFSQWWADHRLIADKESFLSQSNCDSLMAQFYSGRRCVEVSYEIRNSIGEARIWRQMFFLSANDITGDITAICVVNDITEHEENKKKIKQLTDELQDSKMKRSMAQMQPHFLYNALGSIREIVLSDPKYASDLIYDFTTHLRACIHAMSDNGNMLIPFNKEMENVRAYINIEKMRFRERLNVEYNIESDNFKIVPLCIQPLVENSIRHGIFPKGKRGGTVSISVQEHSDSNIITVKDDGIGFDFKAMHESVFCGSRDSTGLMNLIYRLEKTLHAKIQIDSQLGCGTEVTIVVPKGNP